jgi:AcrR family transcriptional regulator
MKINSIREKFKREARGQVLKTARELFVHEGYASFSVRRLATQIGYSPSAIYKHFKDKNEIFDCLVEESFAALMEASSSVKDLPGEDPLDRLQRGMRAYVDFGIENPDHYRFAFLLQRPDTGSPLNTRQTYENLKDRIRKCVAADYFAAENLDLMAQSLWAAVHGITSLLIQRPDFPWVSKSKLANQVIESAIVGLRTYADDRGRLKIR